MGRAIHYLRDDTVRNIASTQMAVYGTVFFDLDVSAVSVDMGNREELVPFPDDPCL